MTKSIRNLSRYVLTLGCLVLSGCVSWTGPQTSWLPETPAAPELPSEQFRPIVRGTASSESPARAVVPPSVSDGAQRLPHRPTSSDRPSTSGKSPRSEPIVPKPAVIRGQQPDTYGGASAPTEYPRQPMPTAAPPTTRSPIHGASPYPTSPVAPAQYTAPFSNPYNGATSTTPSAHGIPPAGPPISYPTPYSPAPEFQPAPTDMPGQQPYTGQLADLIVNVREQQTGRFMFGVGVNSDAGLTAQVVLDEYNFDWKRFPHRCKDIIDGTAWRGGGQRLRIEAIPGSQLQRYLVNFTEPYLLDTNISLNLSGFLYDRDYFDWDEQRMGARIGLGYRLTPDLSLSAGVRLENVTISDPRVRNVEQLNEVLGDNALYSGRVSLTHDTRDSPFAATEGHLLELSFEQAFGDWTYPRGIVDYRRYFLLSERPDGSGRHTLGASMRVGISGSDTPVYDNFFAGGYSTIRGFRFRNANPKDGDIYVGGQFSFLGSAEYMFPITADDMIKGVVFCDYGTIEEEVQFEADDFRVALGAGLRVAIPAMGPAPIALDFAIPVAREDTDRIQNFSFFVGFGR